MESFIGVLQQIQEIVWGPPTMILLLITGLYYTLRLGFLQFVHLPKAIRYIFEKEEGAGAGDSRNQGQRKGVTNAAAIEALLRARLPNLQAIYAFGSRVEGTAGPDSDLDLAVLVSGYADPMALWNLAGELADLAGCAVDLLDFRAASTVMKYRILTTGQRWWAINSTIDAYEAGILSDKTELDTARAQLLADIQREGRVHG